MDQDLVAYRKAKQVYLVLNADQVTVGVFSNAKAVCSWINGLAVRSLEVAVVYSRLIYVLRKGELFSFSVGGLDHYVRSMEVSGVFIASKKKADRLGRDQLGNVVDAVNRSYTRGDFGAVFRVGFNDYQLFQSGTFKKRVLGWPEAKAWVDFGSQRSE